MNHPISKITRRAFTLVELLIVIAIMLVLVGVAIPTLRLLTKGDTVREAAREINVFVDSARSDAISKGFGGIWIKREDDFNKSIRVFKVKAAQRYTGDFDDVTAYVSSPSGGLFSVYLVASENSLVALPNGIQANDRIQFNNRGPWYTIDSVPPNPPNPPATVDHPVRVDGMGNPIPSYLITVRTDGYPVPFTGETGFRIDRFPVISNRDYVQLPKGSYINLAESGFAAHFDSGVGAYVGGNEFASASQAGILISFRADGSIDRVVADGVSYVPTSSVFLFVNAESEDLTSDPMFDLDNQWISISRADGVVSTANAESVDRAANRVTQRIESRRGIRLGQTKNAN